ncbi:hypothetical protein GON03_17465 [Nocardioides sp. MAH-18]|uniref:Uncharacterized protein n=1 Tax=Nocardioides agri TaxID=2682843 RepID=A0A6L6XUU9_9ACTN|nr:MULTISPECIES: hypothetical protein [unclassified Nocardioides]MBA2956133.1 hypothetical protein [Nocardioides sp. CGMCC 1.13656]MVQ50979.1 hypothetical protein [Nocardioides sp. MAH-18]
MGGDSIRIRQRQTADRPEPVRAEGVPDEEGMTEADVEERVDQAPDEHLSRPDQPDFDPEERRPYNDPPAE